MESFKNILSKKVSPKIFIFFGPEIAANECEFVIIVRVDVSRRNAKAVTRAVLFYGFILSPFESIYQFRKCHHDYRQNTRNAPRSVAVRNRERVTLVNTP